VSESLSENYARGGFGKSLQPGQRPALLVIDFVRAYLERSSPLYQPGGRDGGVFFRKVPALKCFEIGAHPDLAAFAEGLEPLPGETVISKQYASAFFATSLASTLTSLGVDSVLIAGLSTSGCVRASAVDCVQHGFVPLVVREAVGDRAPGPHEANLFDLQAKYAEVIHLADALRYLQSLPARS